MRGAGILGHIAFIKDGLPYPTHSLVFIQTVTITPGVSCPSQKRLGNGPGAVNFPMSSSTRPMLSGRVCATG